MEYIICGVRIISFVTIPIIVRYLFLLAYSNDTKVYEKDGTIKISFPILFKLIISVSLVLCGELCISQYKIEQSIMDVLILSPLFILSIFAEFYICATRVKAQDDWNYFEYRNLLFITKKIYYKDIIYVQKKKKAIFIYLKENKRIYLEEDLENIQFLFTMFGKNKVTVKKAIK